MYHYSHSGFMAGEDKVYDAAFKRAGAIRVDETLDLFYLAESLSKQRRPKGNRLAIVANSGGSAVIAVDTLLKLEGELAELSRVTIETLQARFPSLNSCQTRLTCLLKLLPKTLSLRSKPV